MAATVGICTESVACLPAADVSAFDIEVVALPVRFGLDTYRDGVDLDAAEFYARMAIDPELPTTTAPSVGEYLTAYERLAERGHDEIVAVTLTSRLSGAAQYARLAAESAPFPVAVVDSNTAAAPQGLLVRAAGQLAAARAPATSVVAEVERLRAHAGLIAVIPTLQYLRRGGRAGRLAGLAGEHLGIKPLATLVDGEVRAAGVVRSLDQAYLRMTRHLAQLTSSGDQLEVAVMHADAAEAAAVLAERVATEVAPSRLDIVSFTPVMGAHTGPGVVGVGWLVRPDD